MGSSCFAEVSGAQWSKSGYSPWCQLCLGCGVGSVTGILVSPWSGWGFLRNDMSEAQTGFKHLLSASAFLFQSTASELSISSMIPHNYFAHGACWSPVCP